VTENASPVKCNTMKMTDQISPLEFPGLANSRGAIWSVIFQVLQIPGLRYGPSFSRCCNFQSLFFVVRHFQVLQIQRPRLKGQIGTCLLGTRTLVQLLALYTDLKSQNVQRYCTGLQDTGRVADGRTMTPIADHIL